MGRVYAENPVHSSLLCREIETSASLEISTSSPLPKDFDMLISVIVLYYCLCFVCPCTKKVKMSVLPELRFSDRDTIKLKLLFLNIL